MAKINLKISDFPYYNLVKKPEEIRKNFERLKKYNPKQPSDELNYVLNFKNDEQLLRITDYFSEIVRVRCPFSKNISVYDWYQQNKEKIIKELGEVVKYNDIDYYIWKRTKLCSNFPTIMALKVLKIFKVKRWLDPSSGWGDRLVSAIAYGCEYQGYDPNKSLETSYNNIIDFFGADKKKINIKHEPFEKAKVKTNYYDLVFTSPPFFDLEDYDSSNEQSHNAYKTLKEWKEKFLFPSLLKMESALIEGGHLALYINNYFGYKTYVEDTFDFIEKNTKLKPEGYVSWILTKGVKRKIYIWKKMN